MEERASAHHGRVSKESTSSEAAVTPNFHSMSTSWLAMMLLFTAADASAWCAPAHAPERVDVASSLSLQPE